MRSTAAAFRPTATASRRPERRRLALTGLHSILPGGDGIALLERATLPDGSTAFDSRELRHMRDVRSRLGAAYTAQLVALVAILALAIALHRSPPLALRRPVGAAARLARSRSASRRSPCR